MRWATAVASVAALVGSVSGRTAIDSFVYRDSETGFTFTQYNAPYTLGRTITFRVAVPTSVAYGQPYDLVVQVVAPNDVGWAGLAWGGRMTGNPLTVAWSSGYNVVISSRYAPDHSRIPPLYTGASYDIFKTGTHVNSSYWQYTAKCTGCTYYQGSNNVVRLDPNGSTRLAFAYGAQKPFNPSSNQSSFAVHDAFNSWQHDFATAQNSAFTSLVAKNLGR